MRRSILPGILLFFILECSLPAIAQERPGSAQPAFKEMNVDMPDETVETDLTEAGQWQLETAFLFNKFRQPPDAAVGQMLLRYGVSKRLELKLLAEDGRERDRYMEETVQSNAPLAVGAKLALLKDHGWLPDITLATMVKLPFTSRSSEQVPYWSPIILAAFQNSFGERWKLEYNAGAQQEVYSTSWVWLANASLHYHITQPLEAFVEYYAQFKPHEAPVNNLGGGLAYQIGNQVEIYASGGSTVGIEDYNYFVSGGIAFRTR